MIRKQVGGEFWLIAQHEHALLAARLAEQFGGNGFARPQPSVIRGIALHDCGWPLHDDEHPTLNEQGLPLDVFESPPRVAAMVWREAARRAAALDDPYAALLVSLHVLSLSVIATTPSAIIHERFDLNHPAVRFEVNQFQQQQIEIQENLRTRLGLRIDEPRRFGLAERSADPRERQLLFDFRLLQAMDKLSLSICCTQPPFPTIEPLLTQPGGEDRPLRVRPAGAFGLAVTPWPFIPGRLTVSVPFKRFPAEPFADEASFGAAHRAAAVEQFDCTLGPG